MKKKLSKAGSAWKSKTKGMNSGSPSPESGNDSGDSGKGKGFLDGAGFTSVVAQKKQ